MRRKHTRRRASLPLEPHVFSALKRVRRAYAILNGVALLDRIPDDEKLAIFCTAARELYSETIHFTYALQCSVQEQNQPPSVTIKD